METLRHDLRYALRLLTKSLGFSAVVVLTLALGIGANSAIFSIVNTVLLRPLPYKDPEQLVLVWNHYKNFRAVNSVPDYLDRRQQSKTLEDIAAFNFTDFNLSGAGEPVRVAGSTVTASYFPLLGIQPALGRVFLPEEDQPGEGQVVVLSYGGWQRHFGGDPNIVGQTVKLNGLPHTVVGVMPKNFRNPLSEVDLWKPIAFTPQQMDDSNRGSEYLEVMGRIRSGTTLAQVRAEMDTIAARVPELFPSRRDYLLNSQWGASVAPLEEELVSNVRPALLVLSGAVGLILLIACANVANLLLMRAAARQKEISLRMALGAPRSRILRQLTTESLLFSLLGGGLGLALAYWGVDLFRALGLESVPRQEDIGVDRGVLFFTLGLSVLTGVVLGLAPARETFKTDFQHALKETERGTAGRSRRRLQDGLVVGEVTLVLLLLVGAGLLFKSFQNLLAVSPGFETANRLTVSLTLPSSTYPEEHQRRAFWQAVVERVGALPGVRAAGASHLLPFADHTDTASFTVEGYEPAPGEGSPGGEYKIISPSYLRAMGIPLLRGRTFSDSDTAESERVVLIDETAARRYWREQDPVGKRLSFSQNRWRVIVGVVGAVKSSGLEAEGRPQVYFPYTQTTPRNFSLVVHAERSPLKLTPAIRREVLALDRDLAVYDVRTLEQRVAGSLAQRRNAMALFLLFAGLGLVLAAVGLYSLIAYSITQRTHEIGIRLALGAQPGDIFWLVVRHGMTLTLVGVATGLAAAFAVARTLSSLLFNLAPTDPLTLASVSGLLVVVAFAACALPARRATHVHPLVALRYE